MERYIDSEIAEYQAAKGDFKRALENLEKFKSQYAKMYNLLNQLLVTTETDDLIDANIKLLQRLAYDKEFNELHEISKKVHRF